MRKLTDPTISVSPGATIAISSTASGMTLNLTGFPNHAACSAGSSPMTVTDSGLVRTGRFKAPLAINQQCAVVLVFDFAPDGNNEFPLNPKYVVTISDGTNTITDTPIEPPPVVIRTYRFVTE